MDFKLLLLLLGMGQLVVVVLYALWGFFGGLKRELKCTAVLLILLLLGWLIFSDPAMMMGIKIPGAILSSVASSLGVSGETASIWEVVLQILQAKVPNGSALFVEGREAYELAYDLVAGVLRGVGLMVITVGMLYLAGLIRFISHLVKAIVSMVKKAKAKNALPEEVEETPSEEEPEQVIVLSGLEGADDVVVTTDVNELPAPKPITQRIWGAVVGLVKACVVLCITFVPLSGIVSILDETSEETRTLISDLVSGDVQLTEGQEGESSNIVDIVFDFVEDYKSSPLGMCVESTSYFFGDSFSTLLFDSTFYFTTDTQRIPLRQELVTFIHAANALEGNIDYKNLEQDKLSNALDELKESQLLPEFMPVVIEFAYETKQVKELLVVAGQEAPFLQLRYINWDKDIETLLDAVKAVYSLNIFAEEFNYLTLDVETVRTIVELISSTELVPGAMPIAVQVAVKLDAVQELIKDPNFKPVLNNIDWAEELDGLVDIYASFQEFGIESLDGINKDVILDAIFKENKETALKNIMSSLAHMDLFTAVVAPIAERVLDAKFAEVNEGQFKSLVGVLPIEELSASQWESDLHTIVDLADKFYDLGVFGFELVNMDITSDKAIEALKFAIDSVFGSNGADGSEARNGLNLLREGDTLLKVVDWAFKYFDLVSLDADLELNHDSVDLPTEGNALKKLIDVYAELVKYEEFDLVNGKVDVFALLEKENMGELITVALEALVESNIVLNTLDDILEHKLLPLVSKYEDADKIVGDIIDNTSSKDLINEVIRLVEAVFSAKDLGLFQVPRDGLKAIDFAKTEEMKILINALCDSILFDGFEARILKVALKVAGIDVELELLDVDYDAEQVLLNQFVDTIAPILQNELFNIFDEEGNIVFSDELKSFLLTEENAQILVDAVQVLFGDYGQEPVTTGSALVTNLLKPLYHKFLEGKIPANLQGLMEEINIDAFTAEEIANDVRILVYVADELVEFGIFGIIDGKLSEVTFASKFALGNGENIIRALGNTNIISRRTGAILAFAINFVVDAYNEKQVENGKPQFIMSKLYAKDFEAVVWENEIDALVNAYKEVIELLDMNGFTKVNQIEKFMADKAYLTADFLTVENGNKVLNIVEHLVGSQIIPIVVDAAEAHIYRLIADKGFELTPILDVENEKLSEDLKTVVNVARKAINLGALEYVYNKDISNIDFEIVASIFYDENGADLSDLNILQKHQAKIISEVIAFVIDKVAPKSDFTITKGDLKNANVVNDFEKLSEIVVILGEVVKGLELQSLNDIIDFAKNIKANELLKDERLVNEANIERVFDILSTVAEMTYFEAISPIAFNEAISSFSAKLPSLSKLYGTVSGAELAEDLKAISSIADELNEFQIVDFILGKSVYSLKEQALADILEVVLNTNIINNNNYEIVVIIVDEINKLIAEKVPAVKGLEFKAEAYLFADFTAETWAAEQELFAQAIAKAVKLAFDELGVVSIASIKSFDVKSIDYHNTDLIEGAGDVVADLISLETVGALLPGLFDYAIDLAKHAVVAGQELDLDLLYILHAYENGELTNDMLAQDVITLVDMAVIALTSGVVDDVLEAAKNKDFNNMELQLEVYGQIVAKLGYLNILSLDSAKLATEIVNLAARLAKTNFTVVEKDFIGLTDEEWLEDSNKLGEVLVNANAILEELGLSTINEISAFVKDDAKNIQEYLDFELIDAVVATLQSALSFNAGEKVITKAVNYALPRVENILSAKEQFVSVELDFLLDTVSQATLHDDVATIGEIAKQAISFGVFEYLETKDIQHLDLTYIANIVYLIGELNLYNQAREGWYVNAALVASDVTKKNFHLSYEDLEGINFEEDNEQLRAVIMLVDKLLKDNKHESLSELINFAKDLGASYEQWATYENGKAVVDILKGLGDVDILMACGASSMEYVIYLALTQGIDVRFLYDLPYKGADLGADVKLIANILDEALEFGLIEIVWHEPIEKIDLSHIQNIVKYIDQLHIFGLDKAEWTSFIANFVGEKLNMNITVSKENFKDVDWALENANVVDLIGKVAEILAHNHFESTTELSKFVSHQAYLSNQYVTVENVEYIAQLLDCLAKLDVLEQLLPNLVEFAMVKLNTGVEGDFTSITSKEFTTLAYMVREVIAFGTVEMYNNILWNEKYFYEGEFELEHVINVLEAIEELNIYTIDRAQWVKFVASKVGFELSIETLEAIDWTLELAKVVEIIENIDALMQNTHLTNLEFIYRWVEREGYKSAQYITDENVLLIADLIETISELQVLAPYGGKAFDLAFSKVGQLNYLVGAMDGEAVIEDLVSVANIIRSLVEFDTIDLFYWGTTEEFKFDALRNALELALNLNVLNVKRANTMALVLNYALASVNAKYSPAEFKYIDWEKEDATILAIYDQAVVLLEEMNIENTAMVDAYINEKLYLLAQYTNETTIGYAVEIINLVADIQELRIVIDELALVALNNVAQLSFLADAIESGIITDEELVADVEKLVEIANGFLEYELYDMIYSNDYKAVDTDKFIEIFVKFDEMNVFNELRPEWSIAIVNALLGSNGSISKADLAHITEEMWAGEIYVLANTIVKAYDYAVVRGYADNAELNKIYHELIGDKKYQSKRYLVDLLINENGQPNEDAVDALLAIFVEAAQSEVSGVVLHEALEIVVSLLDSKGIDLTKLPEIVTIKDLQADVELVAEAAKDLIMFGMIDLYVSRGTIPYEKLDYIYDAVEALLNTNIANKDSGYLLGGILRDYASRTMGYFAEELYLRDKVDSINAIIEDAAYIALTQEIYTVSDVVAILKAPKSFKVKINSQLNSALEAVSEILKEMANDEFYAQVILSGSLGYLSGALKNYPGILDIYKIYTGKTLSEDIERVANAIDALSLVDVYGILSSNEKIPYNRVDVLETLLTELMGLYYFNGEGRIDAIVSGVEYAFNADLSAFDDMELDLAGDAAKLVASYEEFLTIINSENWPYIYVNDIKTKSLALDYILSKAFIDPAVAAFKEFKDTTIFRETHGALAILLIPICKYALPEYYEATNIENCSLEDIINDMLTMVEMAQRAMDSDILAVLRDRNSSFNTNSIIADVRFLMDKLFEIKLLQQGAMEALADLLLRDLVYGKTYKGIYFPEGAFELSEIDAKYDAELIAEILEEVAVILSNSNIDSLGDVQAHLNKSGVIEIVADEANLEAIANILEKVSEMTFFRSNAASLWNNFVYPRIESSRFAKYAKYANYEGATSLELAEDLGAAAQMIRLANGLGIVDVYNGAEIDYEQVAEIEELLTVISQLNYLEINHERIYNFIARRIEARGGVMFDLDEFILSQDIVAAAKVYEAILPILTDEAFAYKTLSDYLDVLRSGNIDGKKQLLEVAYENRSSILDAYHVIHENGLGKYAVVLVLPAVKHFAPEYHQALNLDGYTYEDLKADTRVALDIATRIRHSQLLQLLVERSTENIDFAQALDDVRYCVRRALDMKIIGNNSLEAIANITLEKYVYGKEVAGITLYDCHLDFSGVNAVEDGELIAAIFEQCLAIAHNSGISTYSDAKALLNVAGVKKVLADEVNLELIANIMELVSEMSFVNTNAANIWNYFVIPNLESSRLAKYAKLASYQDATSTDLAEDLYTVAQIVRAINGLGIVDAYHGAQINYNQADEVEQLLALVAQLNYLEVNHERMYNFINRKVTQYGGVMFGIEEFTLAEDLVKFAKVYESVLPILMDEVFPYTTAYDYLEIVRTRNITGKKAVLEAAYNNKGAILDAYHAIHENGLGKYGAILVLPAINVVAPGYYQLLNIEGYTYEDLRADASVGLEMVKIAKESQLLDILVNRGSAVVDYNDAVETAYEIMMKVFELRILGNNSLERIAQYTLEKYVYGKTIAGVTITDCLLDFSNVDAHHDALLLKDIMHEVTTILTNSGITTLGQLRAHMNRSGVKEILINEDNLDSIANIITIASEMTLVETNIVNVWNNLVLPKLEGRNLDRFVKYEGATPEQLLEDVRKGAQIIIALNDLGIVEVYRGADINYDQVPEVKALLNLIADLNYFEIDQQTIFDLIASKVSALYHYNVSPQDLEISQDIRKLGSVYEQVLPILTNPEYPFTTLNQYLDVLRTRNIPSKTVLANLFFNNMQVAVNTYNEIIKLDTVKYCVLGAYNKAHSLGKFSEFVSLFNPETLTLSEVQHDLAVSAQIAQIIVDSGVKLAVKENGGSKTIGLDESSVVDFAAAYDLIDALYELICLEGDFDSFVAGFNNKLNLGYEPSGLDAETEKVIVYALIDLIEDIKVELGLVDLGDLLDHYNDLEGTLNLVIENPALRYDILDFVAVASTTELGQGLFKAIYNNYLKSNLPADYQDLIDFENPAYTPSLWRNDLEKLFELYDMLEDMNYSDPGFEPTFAQVLDIYDALFAANGIYSTRTNPKEWMESIIFTNLPSINGFSASPSAVPENGWDQEVIAIRDVLVSIASIVGIDAKVSEFSADAIYEKNNWQEIKNVLTSISDSLSMRELLVAVLNSALDSNSSGDPADDMNIANFKSDAFIAQSTTYTEAYWTDDEIELIAKIVVTINSLLYDQNGNFKPDNLDITDPDIYGDCYSDPFNADGTYNESTIGAVHLFQLMYQSQTFDITSLGGPGGTIAKEIDDVIGDVSLIGQFDEVDDVTYLFIALTKLSDVAEGQLDENAIDTISEKIKSSPDEITQLFGAIQSSDVLQGALPFLLNKLIVSSVEGNGLGLDATWAFTTVRAIAVYNGIEGALVDAIQNPTASNVDIIYDADPAHLTDLFQPLLFLM